MPHPSPFQVRQRAAALIQSEGRVLLHRVVGDAFWALPGGGIDAGETAAQALVRELQEELGQPMEPGALACVVENFFTYAGTSYHEIGLYLHATPPPEACCCRARGPMWASKARARWSSRGSGRTSWRALMCGLHFWRRTCGTGWCTEGLRWRTSFTVTWAPEAAQPGLRYSILGP